MIFLKKKKKLYALFSDFHFQFDSIITSCIQLSGNIGKVILQPLDGKNLKFNIVKVVYVYSHP
jgi:hypothetical protein